MPMQISVRITDHGVYQGLRKVGAGLPEVTGAELDIFMDDVQYQASGGYSGGNSYALVPERGGKPRTGGYGRSFAWQKNGLTYRLTNATYSTSGKEYGIFVGGNAAGQGQAAIHSGWWPLILDVVERMVNSQLVQRVEQRLTRFFQEAGIGL